MTIYVPHVHRLTTLDILQHIFLCFVFGSGGFDGINLQGFDDAMLDASTGLTHCCINWRAKAVSGRCRKDAVFPSCQIPP